MAIDTQVAIEIIKPLAFFIGAMTIYSIFIFKFYHFLAKKNILNFNLKKFDSENSNFNRFFDLLNYILEYLILTPIAILFWFLILSGLLTLLAKNQTIQTIMLISLSVVGTVRVLAHYNESLSNDLSKMLPFALLGVFLVDITYLNLDNAISLISQIPSHSSTLAYYLGFIIFLEFILRILSFMIYPFIPSKKEEKEI